MSLSILKQFGFGQNIIETRILLEVSNLINNIRAMKGETFDAKEKVLLSVQSIISRIVFGQPVDPTDKVDSRLMLLILKSPDLFINLLPLDILPPLRFLPKFRKCLNDATVFSNEMFELIDQKIDRSLRQDAEESFVSCFAEKEGSKFDRVQLKVTLRDLVFAGTDTVTSTMMWAIVLLANHPAVQERLQKEIDSVVPRDRQPSLTDLSKMTYLEATVLEIMRCKTVLPFGTPRATLRDTEVGGFFIPKHTQVSSSIKHVPFDFKEHCSCYFGVIYLFSHITIGVGRTEACFLRTGGGPPGVLFDKSFFFIYFLVYF